MSYTVFLRYVFHYQDVADGLQSRAVLAYRIGPFEYATLSRDSFCHVDRPARLADSSGFSAKQGTGIILHVRAATLQARNLADTPASALRPATAREPRVSVAFDDFPLPPMHRIPRLAVNRPAAQGQDRVSSLITTVVRENDDGQRTPPSNLSVIDDLFESGSRGTIG